MGVSLARLIGQRMKDLVINRSELARRMGYSNPAKGCRRIDNLCAGDLRLAEKLRLTLAQSLGVDVEEIDESIEVTRAEQITTVDADYGESFKPHAVILTERWRPSPIFIYAMTGGARHRIISFSENSGPNTYAVQAREALPETVLCLGRTTGYVVNYSPDFALRFNKEGRLEEELDRALCVEPASASIGGRRVDEKTWNTLLGNLKTYSSLRESMRDYG